MHEMIAEQRTETEVLFVCPSCPRRLVFALGGGYTVIDQGDLAETHFGSTSPDLVMNAAIATEP